VCLQSVSTVEPAFGLGLWLWVPALRPAFAGHSAGMTRGGKRGRAPSSAHFSRKRVSAVRDLLEPHRLRTRLAGPGTSSGGNEVELRRLHLSSRMDARRRPGGSPGPIRPVCFQPVSTAEPAFGLGLGLWVPDLRPACAGRPSGMTRVGFTPPHPAPDPDPRSNPPHSPARPTSGSACPGRRPPPALRGTWRRGS
jgi:hypothetical protein